MKLGEKIWYDEASDSYIHKKVHDFGYAIDHAKELKKLHGGVQGDNRLVGVVDAAHIAEWLKEAGVAWDDVEARADVIKRKMLSGEFDKLRVWEGTY